MSHDASDLEAHRTALTGHCYRMLGSAMDADDAVQETLVRAWKNLERFDGRSALRTWLFRIATNVCLDLLGSRARRERPTELGPHNSIEDPLNSRPRTHWLEPVPDALVLPADADPAERLILRQSIRLAFVAALQHLPPKQRAVLLLADVLGWSSAEIAESMDTTTASVNSALQRARATLATRRELGEAPLNPPEEHAELVDRYVSAFERYDMDALTALLHEDVRMSMPPYTLWLQGPEAVRGWMLGRGAACRGSRLIHTEACGSIAFGQYKPGEPDGALLPWSLTVLEVEGERISSLTFFLDVEALFPRFNLPPMIFDR